MYNTVAINDVIKRPDEVVEIADPVMCYPAIVGAFSGMAYGASNIFYPAYGAV